MNEKIHVSVIVPEHNEEKYVKNCIAKVRSTRIDVAAMDKLLDEIFYDYNDMH